MVTDCNFSFIQEPLRSTSGNIVTMQEIIGSNNKMYMLFILISSIILFLYVIYTNFILDTKFDILKKYQIDVHELAILPSIALFIISLSFFGVI